MRRIAIHHRFWKFIAERLGQSRNLYLPLVFCLVTALATPAQTFRSLAYFNEVNGANPAFGPMVQGPDGNFYGVTLAGGDEACSPPDGCGTIFKVTLDGLLTTLHIFEMTDGWGPTGLVLARDGSFYGTTELGGSNSYGNVFKITVTGKFTVLHNFVFTDGYYSRGPLIQAPNGNFYGTALEGGDVNCISPYGCGTVFRMTSEGSVTPLHYFEYNDGAFPEAGVILGKEGNFYGTTSQGGNSSNSCESIYGCGTVFRMSPNGDLTTLHYFCSLPNCVDGYQPSTPVIQASDGRFYGTTSRSAQNHDCHGDGCGTIFQVSSEGNFGTVHVFEKTDGWDANGLTQATDGNLYGTTSMGGDVSQNSPFGLGTVFKIAPGGTLTTLYEFGLNGAQLPEAPLVQGTDGTFFGTTDGGGVPLCFQGCGTIFSFSVGLGPFVSLVGNPAKVGQTFGILGQRLGSTTSVSLNGAPATFTVKSDTAMTAVVPEGATTGFVTVTTSDDTLTSNQEFRVLP